MKRGRPITYCPHQLPVSKCHVCQSERARANYWQAKVKMRYRQGTAEPKRINKTKRPISTKCCHEGCESDRFVSKAGKISGYCRVHRDQFQKDWRAVNSDKVAIYNRQNHERRTGRERKKRNKAVIPLITQHLATDKSVAEWERYLESVYRG